MKLLRVNIINAETCGGLLDGLNLIFRHSDNSTYGFDPLCLVGINGAGKSQFLQALVEIFQLIINRVFPEQERKVANPDIEFEIEYLIQSESNSINHHVKISRHAHNDRKKISLSILIKKQDEQDEWIEQELNSEFVKQLVPSKIVGYTSGENETLSLPFLVSRSGYAEDVTTAALKKDKNEQKILDTRLMLIDYSTNLEVLIANLLLSDHSLKNLLIGEAKLRDIFYFRCVVQLAHPAAPKVNKTKTTRRKGIQLTEELEGYIQNLQNCASSYKYDEKTESYIMDFYYDDACKEAFSFFWKSSLELYTTFHKIAMLNDLAIPKKARERFNRETKSRKFASQLPQPPDEDKVCRFESVKFRSSSNEVVDYVSLSDGEHQLAQLLGTLSMLSKPNVLFILDEPESHFNPQWRVKFISRLMNLKTIDGERGDASSKISKQDALITTHSPFIPSDMDREKVFIFFKTLEDGLCRISYRHPLIQTYGSRFDSILNDCFGIDPPISEIPKKEITDLIENGTAEDIEAALDSLGSSTEKMRLVAKLSKMKSS